MRGGAFGPTGRVDDGTNSWQENSAGPRPAPRKVAEWPGNIDSGLFASSGQAGQAVRRKMVAQVHSGKDPRQRQIPRRSEKRFERKRFQTRALIQRMLKEDLEPDAVISALGEVEVPIPGGADHGRLANEDRKQVSARKPSSREVSGVRQIGAGKTSTATA
jgi:hypothetical protein